MPVYCLSIHADYACRRSVACCTSGWPIPVETPPVSILRTAIVDGRLDVPATVNGDRPDPFVVWIAGSGVSAEPVE
jgi:hypothetical protein